MCYLVIRFLFVCVCIFVGTDCQTVDLNKSNDSIHLVQERQAISGLFAYVGVPLVATYLEAPGKIDLSPKYDSTLPNSGCEEFLNELKEFLSKPIEQSGRGKGCSSSAGTKRTKTTSRVNSNGRLMFVSESVSSMMAPGGDDPQKPPTPPPKVLPLPRIVGRPRKRPRLDGTHPVYEVEDDEAHEEVEIITLDDDEADVTEVIIPIQTGAIVTIDMTNDCSNNDRISSSSSSSGVLTLEYEKSASESSNGPDEVQFMTGVPLLRPHPGTDLNPRGSRQPVTPFWRGLIWGTSASRVTNTCVMDSFFSHLIYLGRRFPLYFRLHLNAAQNEPERFILYMSQRTDGRSRYSLSQCIHHGWSQVVSAGTFPTVNGVINMVGSQDEAVFTHLRQSDRIWLTHQCGCLISTRVDIRRDRHSWTPAQVQALSSPVEDTREESSKRASKKCKDCKLRFRYVRSLVSQATWFHAFNVPRTVTSRDGYPVTIEMQEIGTNALVHFDLGYFSYNGRDSVGGVRHYTSVHVIPDQGIFYYSKHRSLQKLMKVDPENNVKRKFEFV